MKKIELTIEKIESIRSELSEENLNLFEIMLIKLNSQGPLNYIKEFVSDFNETSPIDNLIAVIVGKIINDVGGAIEKSLRERKEKGGSHYSGLEASRIAIAKIRDVANELELHAEEAVPK